MLGKFWRALAPTLALVAACVAPTRDPFPSPPAEAQPWREVSYTLHGGKDLGPEIRRAAAQASAKWLLASEGRIDVRVTWASSGLPRFEGVRSGSERVAETDDHFRGQIVMAWTEPSGVYLILDRIEPEQLTTVITHELGHVIGFADLPTNGSIMSGKLGNTRDLSPDDLDVCRKAGLCPQRPQ